MTSKFSLSPYLTANLSTLLEIEKDGSIEIKLEADFTDNQQALKTPPRILLRKSRE